jgi:hypothetical protein
MRGHWYLALLVAGGYGVSLGCFGSRTNAFAPFSEDGSGGAAADDDTSAGPGTGGTDDVGVGVGGFGPGSGGVDDVGVGVGGFGPGSGGFGPGPGPGGGPAVGGAGGVGGIGGAGTGGAGGGPTTTIDCVNQTCTSGQVCCHNLANEQNSACGAPGTCMGPATIEISCQGPSDCGPMEICCGIYDFMGFQQGYEEVRCDATCDPPQNDLTGITMCAGDPDVCPDGAMDCLDSGSLPDGFFYCDPN